MKISGNQPYFLPYIGYWQLINAADIFEIADDYPYIKKGWVNRNRLLYKDTFQYIILPIEKQSSFKLIKNTYLSYYNPNVILKMLQCTYGKAPFYDQGLELMKNILFFPDKNLSAFILHSIEVICNYLEIQTKILLTSSLEGNSLLKREHRIYDQCARLGADTYINAIGGMELYDFEEFKKRGITLKFLKSKPIEYKQFKHPFVPNLSILDVIMFNSREECIKMLNEYDLITKD